VCAGGHTKAPEGKKDSEIYARDSPEPEFRPAKWSTSGESSVQKDDVVVGTE
jgi:hypothetical protein